MLGRFLSLFGAAEIVLWVWLSRRTRTQVCAAEELPAAAGEQPEQPAADVSLAETADIAGGADAPVPVEVPESTADEPDAPAADDPPQDGAN